MLDSQAVELPGGGGYKYFGVAKDLPGVRELFQKKTPYEPKKSRSELYKHVSFNYYGFGCDDDLLQEEQKYEQMAHEREALRFGDSNPQILDLYFNNEIPTV